MAEVLDNIEQFKQTDKSDMYTKTYSLPDMLEEGWKTAQSVDLGNIGKFDNIVISGMGGSAISGDIVNTVFLDQIPVPVYINRSYEIPAFISERTLFIAISYSGNTEETLSALDKALSKKCSVIAITSGGKLGSLAKNRNFPVLKIPDGFPPRSALGYILSSLIYILSSTKQIDDIEESLNESIMILNKTRNKFAVSEPIKTNEIKQVAKKMQGKIPIIMSCVGLTYAVGVRLKSQLNENTKKIAVHMSFPELNHNDIVGLAALNPAEHNYFTLLLRDPSAYGRMTRRVEVTKSLISSNLKGFNELWSQGRSRLARVLSLILYTDILSIYLAVLEGHDPTPIKIIDQLKKELTR